jgi:hypothetical protein
MKVKTHDDSSGPMRRLERYMRTRSKPRAIAKGGSVFTTSGTASGGGVRVRGGGGDQDDGEAKMRRRRKKNLRAGGKAPL